MSAACCPLDPRGRVEVRRLVEWFNDKMHSEVTGYLVTEKIFKRYMSAEMGGGPPDMAAIRAARSNVRYHLAYVGYLMASRNWLAGDRLSFADLAAAAQLSVADYLGDVPWHENETAKNWYARVKSRPSFRSILADRMRGHGPAGALRGPRLLSVEERRRAPEGGAAVAQRLAKASTPWASPRPTPSRSLRNASRRFCRVGHHGDMDWMEETPRAAGRSARRSGRRSAASSCSA